MTHVAPTITPLPQVTLEDAQPVLGDFFAQVMQGIDTALAEIGDGDWKDGVRQAVIREASHRTLELFIERGITVRTVESLDSESLVHLGRYAVARAQSLALADTARRLENRAPARS